MTAEYKVFDNKELYTQEIAPLVHQVIDKCREQGLSFLMVFDAASPKKGQHTLSVSCHTEDDTDASLELATALTTGRIPFDDFMSCVDYDKLQMVLLGLAIKSVLEPEGDAPEPSPLVELLKILGVEL